MKKVLCATTIYLPRGNHARCPIYEHDGKFYIIANKHNTSSYQPLYYDGIEYTEVVNVNGYWFKE